MSARLANAFVTRLTSHKLILCMRLVAHIEQRYQYEMQTISDMISQRQTVKAVEANEKQSKSLWQYSSQPAVYRPFTVLVLLFFFQQISGIYAIIFYAVNLCVTIGASHGSLNEYTAMLFINITRFVFIIINVMYVSQSADIQCTQIFALPSYK